MALWKPSHSYKMPSLRLSHLIRNAGHIHAPLPIEIVELVAGKADDKGSPAQTKQHGS